MKLVADWKQAWKWLSVRFVALAAAVQASLLAFPETLTAYIPANWLHVVVIVLLAASVIGRLVDQPKA